MIPALFFNERTIITVETYAQGLHLQWSQSARKLQRLSGEKSQVTAEAVLQPAPGIWPAMQSRNGLILFVILPFVLIEKPDCQAPSRDTHGSERGRCRGGSFRGADSQHVLLVHASPCLSLVEKWVVFSINCNILLCLSTEIPQLCFSQLASLWASV